MKILIADELPQDKIEVLREKGYECIVEPDLKAEQIPEKISYAMYPEQIQSL